MQPSPTCTGNPFCTCSFQDIVIIGSEAHAAYIGINAVTSGFVKPNFLGGGPSRDDEVDTADDTLIHFFPLLIPEADVDPVFFFCFACIFRSSAFCPSPVLFLLTPQPSFSSPPVFASSSPLFLSSSFLAPQSVPVFSFPSPPALQVMKHW